MEPAYQRGARRAIPYPAGIAHLTTGRMLSSCFCLRRSATANIPATATCIHSSRGVTHHLLRTCRTTGSNFVVVLLRRLRTAARITHVTAWAGPFGQPITTIRALPHPLIFHDLLSLPHAWRTRNGDSV